MFTLRTIRTDRNILSSLQHSGVLTLRLALVLVKMEHMSQLAHNSLWAHDLNLIQNSSDSSANKSLQFTISFLHLAPFTFIHFHQAIVFVAYVSVVALSCFFK